MTNPTRQRALITGASSGIGEGFARKLAEKNYDLLIAARRKDRLDQLATELSGQYGVDVEAIDVDLAQDEGVGMLEERLRSEEIDLLVNNAGFGTVGPFAELPIERELEELRVNIRALVLLSHAALVAMKERRRGSIINVASTAAFQPIPYNATYSASKAFVLHFSEALHEEAKEYKVTVTCVCPGPVQTEFQQVAGIDGDRLPSMMYTSVDTVVDATLSGLRLGRAITVPGPMNMVTAATSQFAPRFLSRRIAGNMFRNRGRQ
ncbi:MAG: SDR family oxidoreductase [Dehalococcoidia bacterium]